MTNGAPPVGINEMKQTSFSLCAASNTFLLLLLLLLLL